MDETSESGTARCPGPSVQDYLDPDSRPVPPRLRFDVNDQLGSEDIATDRYLSRVGRARDARRSGAGCGSSPAWTSEIPEVGDHEIYEIGDDSLIVVRTGAGRDPRLLQRLPAPRPQAAQPAAATSREFRCPFHGFAWNLDGTIKDIPCAWDFPPRQPGEVRACPQAQVGHLARLRLHQHGPVRASPFESYSRHLRRVLHLAAGGPLQSLHIAARSALQLEGRARRRSSSPST